MDRVYSKKIELDDFTKKFIDDIVDADDGLNPDLKVEFKGFRHDGMGFTIALHNVESFPSSLTDVWGTIAHECGMVCDVNSDMVNGEIILKCQRVTRSRTPVRSSFSSHNFLKTVLPFKTLVYLSVCVGSVYMLWMRHNGLLQ